jgi:hypothetical protein
MAGNRVLCGERQAQHRCSRMTAYRVIHPVGRVGEAKRFLSPSVVRDVRLSAEGNGNGEKGADLGSYRHCDILGNGSQAVLLVVDVPAKETHLPEGLTFAVHLSAAEAREAAHGLLRKAEEAEQDSPLPHPGLA